MTMLDGSKIKLLADECNGKILIKTTNKRNRTNLAENIRFVFVIGRSSCHDRMTRIREVYHGNTCATEGFFIEAQKGSISAITF